MAAIEANAGPEDWEVCPKYKWKLYRVPLYSDSKVDETKTVL